MIAKPTLPSNPTLADLLIARARAASDSRLVLDVGVGLATTLVLVWWQPRGWPVLASVALCLAAFGSWGIADRELGERGTQRGITTTLLKVLQIAAVIAGVLSGAVITIQCFAILLGRWIS